MTSNSLLCYNRGGYPMIVHISVQYYRGKIKLKLIGLGYLKVRREKGHDINTNGIGTQS